VSLLLLGGPRSSLWIILSLQLFESTGTNNYSNSLNDEIHMGITTITDYTGNVETYMGSTNPGGIYKFAVYQPDTASIYPEADAGDITTTETFA
jgi:hypothetical protein